MSDSVEHQIRAAGRLRRRYRMTQVVDRVPLDYELHQVVALFGHNAPKHLAEMQAFCDAYGAPDVS